jgi:hypothetical protein
VRDRGDAGPHELATAYYSLTGGGEVVPRDGWQIVRVEVPRASLGALGFAVNPALADEPITADVMLGHDGVARAIRFVQTTDPGERRNR